MEEGEEERDGEVTWGERQMSEKGKTEWRRKFGP